MPWFAVWMTALVLFLLLPVVFDRDRRRRWFRHLCLCRWCAREESVSDDPNAFRYVLSRAQEDEIREAYLRPKLDVCSVVLQPENLTDAIDEALEEGRSDDDDDDVQEFMGEAPPFLRLGSVVQNGCAICLCRCDDGDRVCWGASCRRHVFHYDCVLNWYMTIGRKYYRKQRRREDVDDVVELITDFPIVCPCCRQPFVEKDVVTSSETSVSDGAVEEHTDVENGADEEAALPDDAERRTELREIPVAVRSAS